MAASIRGDVRSVNGSPFGLSPLPLMPSRHLHRERNERFRSAVDQLARSQPLVARIIPRASEPVSVWCIGVSPVGV